MKKVNVINATAVFLGAVATVQELLAGNYQVLLIGNSLNLDHINLIGLAAWILAAWCFSGKIENFCGRRKVVKE